MKIKVLDRLFIKGIIGPYLLSFFVVEFVLIMQFLWKYIDDLLGQGYPIIDFVELILYFGMAMIPMALPLTVLLSSVMVYGEKAEKYELTSMKSAGISLMRLLRPGLVIAIMTMLLSLLASNVLKPLGNRESIAKIRAMKTNKLTYSFEEMVFNTEFKNYSIWIDSKGKDGRTVSGIKIYDHSDPDKTITNYIHADSAIMYSTMDQKYLIMELYDGIAFKELRSELSSSSRNSFNLKGRPVSRMSFSSLKKVFDLSEVLDLSVIQSDNDHYDMLNGPELYANADSIRREVDSMLISNVYAYDGLKGHETKPKSAVLGHLQDHEDEEQIVLSSPSPSVRDTSDGAVIAGLNITRSISEMINPDNLYVILNGAQANARAIRDRTVNRANDIRIKSKRADSFLLRLHQQLSWALVCLLFLFIGGSAGAIVRKGGFGLPLLIAIVFYMIFIMSSIAGERIFKSDGMSPWSAAWLPCLILLPFAIGLTYWAMLDRSGLSLPLTRLSKRNSHRNKSVDQ